MSESGTRRRAAGLAGRFGFLMMLLLVLPLALVAAGVAPPGIHLGWDAANGLGFLALACTLVLFYYAGRPRPFPPFSGRFFANLHRDLGYLAFAFTLLHVVLLLALDPLLLEHLQLTAPLYMLAGLVAAVLMLVLLVISLTPLRRRLWRDYRLFRHVHGWLALALLGFLAWHALGSAYYLNHPVKLALVAAVFTVAMALYLAAAFGLRRRDARGAAARPGQERLRDSARFSHLVSYGGASVALALTLLLVALNQAE